MSSFDALPDRFVDSVHFEPNSGCWLWTGTILRDGYGQFKAGGQRWQAHRYAYIQMIAAVPADLELDHLCRVRHCVNPSHLEPVDHRTNILRGTGTAAANAQKAGCPQGHPFDGANTYRYRGWRGCRTCRQAARRRYAEAREACA